MSGSNIDEVMQYSTVDRYQQRDVNFPCLPEQLDFETNLTARDILAVRAQYLEYAYRAMAMTGRRHVLISECKIVTREMIEIVLVGTHAESFLD